MNAKEAIRELAALEANETKPGVFVYPAEAIDAILGSPDDGLSKYGELFALTVARYAIESATAIYAESPDAPDSAKRMHEILAAVWS